MRDMEETEKLQELIQLLEKDVFLRVIMLEEGWEGDAA